MHTLHFHNVICQFCLSEAEEKTVYLKVNEIGVQGDFK